MKSSMLLNNTTTFDHDIADKDFLFVLKRLLPAKNSPYSLKILIPDTVVFWNGEAKFMVYNGKVNKTISLQNKKLTKILYLKGRVY